MTKPLKDSRLVFPETVMLMLMRSNCARAVILTSIFTLFPNIGIAQTYKPADGYVGTAEVAIKIAEAVLKPIYGGKIIDSEKPLKAILTKDNVWVVTGTLRPGRKGGVAEIRIDKDKGTILNVTHGL